ncbi:hypothetical protein AAY473_034044 [Plecturocebus cupreus]
MNYAMLSTITQGKEENPIAFLEQLWEALRKHTPLSPDSIEGQLILKDKFLRQSATDIRRKLQKLVLGPEQSLESLLNLANSVFSNRDQEEQAETDRRDKKKATALVIAFRQADQTGFEKDTLRKIVPRGTDHLLILSHCAKNHWKAHCSRG